jgi:hypothetical protein
MQSIGASTAAVMVDHLHGLAQTLRDDVDYGPMVMGRSALEAAGRITWLLDPSLDTRGRVIRAFALRVRGLKDVVRNAEAMAAAAPQREEIVAEVERSRARFDHVLADANALGVPVHWNTERTEITMLKTTVPDGAELVRQLLAPLDVPYGALLYGHWSAIGHSTYDAIQGFLTQVGPMVDRTAIARVGSDMATRVSAGCWSAVGVQRAVAMLIAYCGFEGRPYLDAMAGAAPELKRLLDLATPDSGT